LDNRVVVNEKGEVVPDHTYRDNDYVGVGNGVATRDGLGVVTDDGLGVVTDDENLEGEMYAALEDGIVPTEDLLQGDGYGLGDEEGIGTDDGVGDDANNDALNENAADQNLDNQNQAQDQAQNQDNQNPDNQNQNNQDQAQNRDDTPKEQVSIPENASATGDLSWLKGCWNYRSTRYNSRTSAPLTYSYCFDDNGNATVKITQSDSDGKTTDTCITKAQAAMIGNNLVIDDLGLPMCEGGGTYRSSVITCVPGDKRTECKIKQDGVAGQDDAEIYKG
jgi:hypothetical protein